MYFKLQRMGNMKALYNVPEYFKYWKEEGESLFIGAGCVDRVKSFAHTTGQTLEFKDETVCPVIEVKKSSIILRPHQEGFVEELDPMNFNNGIIQCSTGFGKTILALKLFEELKTRTLVIVPRTNLLNQFVYEYKKYFKRDAGVIQGEKESISDFTVATLQSLQRKKDLCKSLSSKFGCVIVDEAHLFVPKKSREVIETFNSKYRYGFTATPKRTDEQSEAIFFTFGPIRVRRELPSATPKVKLTPFYGEIPILEYAKIIDYQTKNGDRNRLILKKIREEVDKGRRVLVLTKRIEHFKELYELLILRDSLLKSVVFKLQADEDNRELLKGLREGTQTFKVLLGTYSLLSTGVDIPSLDTLVLAGDLKSEVLTEQSGGRIRRLFEGKQEPLIIDVQDLGNKILAHQAKARIKFYKSANWLII